MLPSFCNQVITRVRAGQKESRGSTIPDWDNVDTLIINGCSVQPADSDISLDGRVLGLRSVYRVYCDSTTDVKAGDRIIFERQTYVIDEAPRVWQSPTGLVSHLQFTMTLWEG